MGQMSFQQALDFYQRLPPPLRVVWSDPSFLALDALRQPGLEPTFFLHQRGEDFWYHAFHLSAVPGSSWRDVQSAYGYGGPLCQCQGGGFLAEAWSAWRHWCLDQGVMVEFVRFQPLLENHRWYGGTIEPNRQTVWVDLTAGDPWSDYNSLTKRQIKKSVKAGVEVSLREPRTFAPLFRSLYENFITERQAGQEYRFPGAFLEGVSSWEASHGLVAHHQDEVLAAVLLLAGSEVLEYYLGASTPRGRELGAMRALLHEGALLGQRLGCTRFHLGGGTDSDKDNPLLFFKAGFSSLRANYHIGHYVHLPEQYQRLRQQWHAGGEQLSGRVLFYL